MTITQERGGGATGTWLEACAAQGRAQPAGGAHPFALAGPESAWIVLEGYVDVFSACREAGGHHDRQHLFSLGAGEIAWGLAEAADDPVLELLAVATPGTHVVRVPARVLSEPGSARGGPAAVASLVDAWLERLWSALAAGLRPRRHGTLVAGPEQALAAGGSLCSDGPPLWVDVLDGEALLMGDEDLPRLRTGGRVPLAGRAWITTPGAARVRGRRSRTLLDAGELAASLHDFHALFQRGVALQRRRRSDEEARRLLQRRQAEARDVSSALGALRSLLEPRRPGVAPASEGDLLLATCRLVCAAAEVPLVLPPEGRGEAPATIETLADDARLRLRRVALEDDWWRRDLGPLLGFRSDDGRPVALLRAPLGGYELHDAERGTRARVTREVAATLGRYAAMFYRRLPARELRAPDLVRFGLRGAGRELALVGLLGLGAGLLGLVLPLVTGLVFDAVIPGAQRTQLAYLVGGLLVSAAAVGLFDLARGLGLLRLEGRLGAALQAAVWDRLMELPPGFFRRFTAGDLADRAFGVDTIRHDLSTNVVTLLLAGAFGAVNLPLLFWFDLRLALWATFALLLAAGVSLAEAMRLLRLQGRATAIQGRLSGLVLQLVRGIAKLRAAGAETRAWARWAALVHEQRALALRTRAPLQVWSAVYPLLATLLIYFLVLRERDARLSTGVFIAFVAAFNSVLYGLLQSAGALLSILRVVPTFERLRPILETPPEIDERRQDPGELDGEIELAHVSFRYAPDGPPVLSDMSLRIRPGEFVAVVGASGSGKSTLLRLMLGFERPGAGHIYYSGQDLGHLDLRRLRRQIGVVLQNSQLLSGDIYSNVLGSSALGREEVLEALRTANFERDLEALPMGVHTVVSEGGSTLSGGQRQRLLIARAILRKPRILFFDEATSALDNESQAHVSASIARLEATRIVVAHRLSTIMHADRIVVLEHGRVVECGTYAELQAQPGVFAQLVRRQLI
jgi:ATP-binding cassette subfamily C protein